MEKLPCPKKALRTAGISVHSMQSPATVNGLVVTSGQIPIDPRTGGLVGGDIAVQTEQAARNIGEVLRAAGSDYRHVVKTTCFLKDIGDFSRFNEVYGKYFISKPARSCVEVSNLPKGALVEIEVIAEIV